jgi:GalNAc-alpha-(1->4)-GalNAc-alpha-(1->3)-diNAcBac-PP-undecaprenol alpha-1,4-N-acetyl-D-galactosaminyltransferase
MHRKKILLINNGLAPGGIERASVTLANYFASKGYIISIVALYKREHFFQISPNISFFEPLFSRESTNRNFYVLKMMIYLRRTIKKIRPDAILAFGEWTNPFIVITSLGLKIPVYLSDRMSPELRLTKVHRILKKTFYKRATGIIAQTNYAKKTIQEKTGAKNIRVISNPINIIGMVDCQKKNRIITVGRLSKEKGHKVLIEAFSKINNKTWKLSIIGDGEEKEKLFKLAQELGISDQVIFHGYQRDFSLLLSESQVFVLPSLSEGFPNALLEAMAVPLACISSDCVSGPRDIISNGVNGLLVEPGNVTELVHAINRLTEDSELRERLAREAYLVRENYSFDIITQEFLEFLFQNGN